MFAPFSISIDMASKKIRANTRFAPVPHALSIYFSAVTYFDNQNGQHFLLNSVDNTVLIHSHPIGSIAILELFHSRWQWIIGQSKDAGVKPL